MEKKAIYTYPKISNLFLKNNFFYELKKYIHIFLTV